MAQMETIKMTCDELNLIKGIEVSKVDEEHIQVVYNKRNYIRTFYSQSNGVKFYINSVRFIITDPDNIPYLPSIQPDITPTDTWEIDLTNLPKTKRPTQPSVTVDLAEMMRSISEDVMNGLKDGIESTPPSPQPQQDTETVEVSTEPVKHSQYNIICTCIRNDIPVYLHGEAGTGKNYTLQQIAEELNLPFYFTNSVQQEYKVTGFIDAGGHFHETEFYKAFKDGGLFFLDEIDASIPEVLVLLNAAIANRYFEFPNGRIDAHPDFRVVAAGNTVGSGADELYTGRLQLDQATLDRFVIIEFDYDRNIEIQLAQGNIKLVNFVRTLRKSAKTKGIRATFSYRCIMSVTKLEQAGIDIKTILSIAVFKGMNEDTIKSFDLDKSEGSCGRYYYAFIEITGGRSNVQQNSNRAWSRPSY